MDLFWRDEGLVVEVDAASERGRLKVATPTPRGIRVMLVTGRQIQREPGGVLRRIGEALRASAQR